MNKPATAFFKFWQRWLFYSSLLFACFGLAVAFGNNWPVFDAYNRLLAQSIFRQPVLPAEVVLFRGFICGPLGGTIAALYVLMAFVAAGPFKKRERWARNAIACCTLTWCLVDSAICLLYGNKIQAFLINGLSAAVKLLPLVCTWNQFR